jgi:hypothetical protein
MHFTHRLLPLASIALLFTCAPLARAAEGAESHATVEAPYTLEISGATNAALVIGTGSPATTDFTIEAEVAYPLRQPNLDVALDTAFETSDTSGVRFTNLTFVPGLQLNFGDKNQRQSFFIFGGPGFALASAEFRSDTHFAYRFRGGKRFELTKAVSYTPFISYSKIQTENGEVRVIPVAFSFFL